MSELAAECNTLIQYRGLSKHYGKRQIISNIDIDCDAAKSYLLTGENGSGKSTLLRIMAGLLKPDLGQVAIADEQGFKQWPKQINMIRSEVMYLHQMPYLFDGTVERNLSYAVNRELSEEQKGKRITEVLQWAGLEALADIPAKKLSGGEKQRVAIARACLRKTKILLLDEPTANLDQTSRSKTIELLASLKKTGVSLVIACHEYQEFLEVSDGILQLKKGILNKF